MVSFQIILDDDFVKKLERMEQFDEIAPLILEASTQPLNDALKSGLGKHKDTGEAIRSIRSIVKKNKYGWFAVSRPTGKDSKGVRNMQKLMELEFGTEHQSPTPVIPGALKIAEKDIARRMQEAFDEYINQ